MEEHRSTSTQRERYYSELCYTIPYPVSLSNEITIRIIVAHCCARGVAHYSSFIKIVFLGEIIELLVLLTPGRKFREHTEAFLVLFFFFLNHQFQFPAAALCTSRGDTGVFPSAPRNYTCLHFYCPQGSFSIPTARPFSSIFC